MSINNPENQASQAILYSQAIPFLHGYAGHIARLESFVMIHRVLPELLAVREGRT
jgi:hypothetical protein